MGYAILFEADETFESMMTGDDLLNPTNGLGIMSDAISCYVEEERNSFFELEMEYPINGIHAEKLQVERILLSRPNTVENSWQAFRIYRITKSLDNIIHVYARHISYALSGMIFVQEPYLCQWYRYVEENGNPPSSWHSFPQEFTTDDEAGYKLGNIISLMDMDSSNYYGNKFSIAVDSSIKNNTSNIQLNGGKEELDGIKSYMLGKENSLIDIYGGVWYWNNYKSTLKSSRATSNSGKITARYGVNLTELEYEISDENTYSNYMPYVAKDDVILFYLSPKDIDNVPDWMDRTLPIDCSDLYSEQELEYYANQDLTNPITLARAQAILTLKSMAKKRKFNLGSIASKITFKYESLSNGNVGIDDIVKVFYDVGNSEPIIQDSKVHRIKYDVIMERVDEIETGESTQTFKWSDFLSGGKK